MRNIRAALRKHRRLLGPVALALAVIAIFWAVNSPSIVGASAAARELPVYNVKRDNKAVSLTFDAAWGNEDTQELIDILSRYNVKATFFLVGQWVDKYPESVQALYDAGMEIGNHSNEHPHMAKLSSKQIMDEVNACNEKVEAVTGECPTLFRCPYGEYNDNVIETVRDMGMQAIQWNVERRHTKETPESRREKPAQASSPDHAADDGACAGFYVSVRPMRGASPRATTVSYPTERMRPCMQARHSAASSPVQILPS